MRIVFAGTGEFGIPALRTLVASGLVPNLVISQPDRPKGRHGQPTPPPLAAAALELGLPLFQPEKLNRPGPRERIAAEKPDVLVVIAYGQILRPKVLAIPTSGCVNLHGSLLPRHRGASPIQAAILAGDAVTGVTVMRMDEGLDSGPILGSVSFPLGGTESAGFLHDRLADLGAPLLVEALQSIEGGSAQPREQEPGEVTVCGLISKGDGRIDWRESAVQIDRRIRAYHPWPAAHGSVEVRGKPLDLVVEEARVVPGMQGTPGEVLVAAGEELVVATGEGAVQIHRVRPAGRKSQDVGAFLRGYPVSPGDRFAS